MLNYSGHFKIMYVFTLLDILAPVINVNGRVLMTILCIYDRVKKASEIDGNIVPQQCFFFVVVVD